MVMLNVSVLFLSIVNAMVPSLSELSQATVIPLRLSMKTGLNKINTITILEPNLNIGVCKIDQQKLSSAI